MNNKTKVAWIGFAAVVTAGVLGAGVTLIGSKGKPSTVQETSGNQSPAISGVTGNVIIGNQNSVSTSDKSEKDK